LVDVGNPTAPVSADADPTVGGYSIVEADSHDAALALLAGHPHTAMGGLIYVFEVTPFTVGSSESVIARHWSTVMQVHSSA
jgi:hypothetical protein